MASRKGTIITQHDILIPTGGPVPIHRSRTIGKSEKRGFWTNHIDTGASRDVDTPNRLRRSNSPTICGNFRRRCWERELRCTPSVQA